MCRMMIWCPFKPFRGNLIYQPTSSTNNQKIIVTMPIKPKGFTIFSFIFIIPSKESTLSWTLQDIFMWLWDLQGRGPRTGVQVLWFGGIQKCENSSVIELRGAHPLPFHDSSWRWIPLSPPVRIFLTFSWVYELPSTESPHTQYLMSLL